MRLLNVLNIRHIIGQHTHEKLSAQTAYKFVKFLRATDSDEAFYYNKYKEILSEYLEKDSNGNFIKDENNNYKIREGKDIACKEELENLENINIELPPIYFQIEELNGLRLSMQEMLALEGLIDCGG